MASGSARALPARPHDRSQDHDQDPVRPAPAGSAPHPVPTADEDERLRLMIRAELERQHALPVARRTLEMLAEAEAEPVFEEPGYRIVDRSGETRLNRDIDPGEEGEAATGPMTLRDLVWELRERHPALFAHPRKPEKPDSDPVPPPPPEPPHDTLAEVKAAGARFVETQSALARALATSGAERGRSLGRAAGARFERWRTQLGARLKTHPAPAPAAAPAPVLSPPEERSIPVQASIAAEAASPPRPSLPAAASPGPASRPPFVATSSSRALVVRRPRPGEDDEHEPVSAAERLARLARRARAALPRIDLHAWHARDFSSLRRIALFGLAGLTGGALVVAGAVVTRNYEASEAPAVAARPDDAPSGGAAGANGTKGEAAPMPAPAPAPSDPESRAAAEAGAEEAEGRGAEEAPRNPNEVVGVPQVIDTATLKLSGRVVHLFGVEWVRGGQAEELTKYLRGRPVACRPAPGSSAHLCTVEGRDLSEVVLFNGGGRASSEASPDLVAAEDHARTERLGVWRR